MVHGHFPPKKLIVVCLKRNESFASQLDPICVHGQFGLWFSVPRFYSARALLLFSLPHSFVISKMFSSYFSSSFSLPLPRVEKIITK